MSRAAVHLLLFRSNATKSLSTNNTINNKNSAGICGLHYYELALYGDELHSM